MNEDQAKTWLLEHYDTGKLAKLERFQTLLLEESARQNLIAPSTMPVFWSRHVVDSAQLLGFSPEGWRQWVDIGTGAGFPGLIIGILDDRHVTLIEPRKLRASFLQHCSAELRLSNTQVVQASAEKVRMNTTADVISARAVASLDSLFSLAKPFASSTTAYLLPKGAKALDEVLFARQRWHGTFHVKPSIVDPRSGIVIATGVSPR